MVKTKIVVLKKKKLIYGTMLFILAIVLLSLIILFSSNTNKDAPATQETGVIYRAGVYTSVLELNDTLLGLEVVLDKDHINSVRLVNLDEATQTMYPLIEPALTDISNQLSAGVALSDIVLSESSKYTQTLLLNHIRDTIAKAQLP